MPIYEYGCSNCGFEFEKMQKMSDALVSVCPKCEGKVEKKLSLSGFQFKGAGWYVTDYSNKGKPETKKSEDKAEAGGESKAETKSDTKSEPAKTSETAVTTPAAPKASEK